MHSESRVAIVKIKSHVDDKDQLGASAYSNLDPSDLDVIADYIHSGYSVVAVTTLGDGITHYYHLVKRGTLARKAD